MHKGNSFYQDLIISWKKGWPEYNNLPGQDNKPLYEIAQICAWRLKVDLDTEPGFNRVMKALQNIAAFCRQHKDWRETNLYTINQAMQTIMQQMWAAKQEAKEAEYQVNSAERIYQAHKNKRAEAEKAMREESERLRKEHEENWTEEKEKEYQAWRKSLQPGKVISIELAKEKSVNAAM